MRLSLIPVTVSTTLTPFPTTGWSRSAIASAWLGKTIQAKASSASGPFKATSTSPTAWYFRAFAVRACFSARACEKPCGSSAFGIGAFRRVVRSACGVIPASAVALSKRASLSMSVASSPVRRRSNNAAVTKIYALANQKGGVGKTTTAINLAACLAEAGERALVIDLDPQANATSGLGMRANGTSSYDLLDGAPLAELTKHTAFPNLDLVPSKPELAAAVVELAQRGDGERYLAEALESGTSQYDFVFLDCPPSLGPLTVNALAASDRVLVPVQAEYYALEGLAQLMQSIDLIRMRLNQNLAIGGVLLTMMDGRTRLAAQVEEEVRTHFGPLVFRTSVPRSVRTAA